MGKGCGVLLLICAGFLLFAINVGIWGFWPVILIAVGVWMLVKPQKRHWKHDRQWHTPAPAPSAPAQASVQPEPPPAATLKRELPIDIQIRVEQIKHKADALLAYADRFSPFSHDLHVVRQTAAEYLPRTVEAYLALGDEGDVKVGEKSARDELKEQLDLLDRKLNEIAENLQQQDVDRLLANRRFLEERFKPAEGTT